MTTKRLFSIACMFVVLTTAQGKRVIKNETNNVKQFYIALIDNKEKKEEDFPHRIPGINKSALSGVYNDSLQTLTLTFNFNSDDACVTIYKNFNKMYQENIAVSKGTTAVYDMSDYGEGNFVVDVRHESGSSYVYYGEFTNVLDKELKTSFLQSPSPGPFYSTRHITRETAPDSIQYGYDALLNIVAQKTFSTSLTFPLGTANIKVRSVGSDANVYFFDEADPSLLSVSFSVAQGLISYVSKDYQVQSGRTYKLLVTTPSGSSKTGNCTVLVGDQSFINQPIRDTFYPLTITPQANKSYNIFCTSRSEDLELYVLKGSDIGTIAAYNDNYGLGDNFNWGNWPRVEATFNSATTGVYVNNLSQVDGRYNAWAFSNLYVGCEQLSSSAKALLGIPLTDACKDVMVSAPANRNYNQYGWAVGLATAEQPGSYFSGTNIEIAAGARCDKLDSLLRSFGYVETTENDSKCCIDLYGRITDTNDTIIDYPSVRRYYNQYAAGYAWETKLQKLERVFHPRSWLENQDRVLVRSYRPLLLEEVAQNNMYESLMIDYVLENSQLTYDEISLINSRISSISYNDISTFYWYFEEASWDYLEAPNEMYDKLDQNVNYQMLLSLCQSKPQLMNLAYLEVNGGDMVAIRLLEDMITPDQQIAMQRMQARKASVAYTTSSSQADKKKIYRTVQDNAVLYIKDLLSGEEQEQFVPQGITYSNDENILRVNVESHTMSIGFELDSAASVSLSVSTQTGLPISQPYSNQKLPSGEYSVMVNVTQPGIYMVTYIVDGRLYDHKVNIK